MDGVIVIDKPEGWTSHDVVNKVRRLTGSKAGHLGTLDPIATGVLPLVIGKATRLAQFYTRSGKIYEGQVRFGWSTTTYDRAGEATSEKRQIAPTREELEPYLDRFRGQFLQTPPPVSAKKVDGKRAYQLARQSIAVELEPVQVEIYELELLELTGAVARLRAHCSGGTYMRSLAHDLGQAMGCGAHLEELRRTMSGEFEIGMARTIAQLEQLIAEERLLDALVPAAEMLPGLPVTFVDDVTAAQIRHGRNFPASPFRSGPAAKHVKAVSRQNELIAIGEAVLPNLYHPIIVF